MKHFKHLYLVVILSLILLVGCNSTTDTETMPPEVQHSIDNSQAITTPTNHDKLIGLSKYDEEVTITILRELSIGLQELVENLPDETVDQNRWTEVYKSDLGINVEHKWTSEGQYYNQQLNYAITSGDITDLIRVNAEQLRLLNNAGLIQDLSSVFEQYATPFTKSVLSEDAIDTLEVATINGKLMALPEPDFPIDRANFIWLRTDWLETLNLSPPQTIEDVNHIATTFAKHDPDQNGLHDTYGLAVTSYLWDPVVGVQAYMAGFDAFPELWISNSETGELEFGGIQPEVKDALLSLQQLYKEGVIDPDFSLKNGAKVRDAIQANKIGIFYGEQWGSFHAQINRQTDPSADWRAFPIVGNNTEEPVLVPLKFAPSVFYAVNKQYDNPEALIKMFNLHLEKNWGELADFQYYYSNPYPVWQLSPVTPFPARKNYSAYLQIKEARETNNYSNLEAEAKSIQKLIDLYITDGVDSESGWGWYRTYGEGGAFEILEQYINNKQLKYDEFSGTRTETMIHVQSILNDLQHDTYINIILGNPIEQFDEFVEKWYDLGGAQITKEVNEWYKTK